MTSSSATHTTRPYLIRAIYEWCTDHGYTPYVAVFVDDSVQVPREYVKDGEIVLNMSFDATSALKLGNDFVEFKARFGGVARQILVPVSHVVAIYARENGEGMAFSPPDSPADMSRTEADAEDPHLTPHAEELVIADPSKAMPNPDVQEAGAEASKSSGSGRPVLRRIK